MEKCNMACVRKNNKTKMLLSQEYCNCHEPPENGQMGDNEHPNKMLHKAKHTSSSILSYRAGLDPITTFYLVAWIEWSCNIHG